MAPLQCLASLDARCASTGLNSGKQVLVRPVSPEKISQVVGALTFPYSAIQSDPVPALLYPTLRPAEPTRQVELHQRRLISSSVAWIAPTFSCGGSRLEWSYGVKSARVPDWVTCETAAIKVQTKRKKQMCDEVKEGKLPHLCGHSPTRGA